MGELESIRVFLAVAEHESFAEAARQLGITPAAVTRSIAALEDELGVQLLVRTTRQVSLTAAGAVYAARVSPLADGIKRAADETREAMGITAGTLRISAPLSLGIRVLPTVLSEFATLYPQTHVRLSLSDRFVDIVEEDYDLAIRISGPPSDKSTIWRKIGIVPRVLVAARDLVLARGAPKTPQGLGRFPHLSYQKDARPEVWEFTKGKKRHLIKADAAFSADNGDLLAKLVVNGEGVALLPRFLASDDLAKGRLVELLPDWELPAVWLTLYYPPYERLPLKVATFSDFFETHVKETCVL